jgi:hypothetical protein
MCGCIGLGVYMLQYGGWTLLSRQVCAVQCAGVACLVIAAAVGGGVCWVSPGGSSAPPVGQLVKKGGISWQQAGLYRGSGCRR